MTIIIWHISYPELPVSVAAVCISAYRKSDAYAICMTMNTVQYDYEIYDNAR